MRKNGHYYVRNAYGLCMEVTDDMLPLCNFYVNFITFWSSHDNLSSKKARKTKEKSKTKNVPRFGERGTISQAECNILKLRKTCHDC